MRREAVTLRWLAHQCVHRSLGIMQALDLVVPTPMHDVHIVPALAFPSLDVYLDERDDAPRNPLVSTVWWRGKHNAYEEYHRCSTSSPRCSTWPASVCFTATFERYVFPLVLVSFSVELNALQSNIGVDDIGRAILHNFTHSVILHPDEARQRVQATIASPRWAAPEVCLDESPLGPLHTMKSEIYALANVILEVRPFLPARTTVTHP
jgi:hypothetical protein